MTDGSKNAIIKYNDEAVDAEIVDETSALELPSSLNQTNNRNKELLNRRSRASEDELKQLEHIQYNINLANRKKQELLNMNYQNYYNDINYQNNIITIHNNCLDYAKSKGIQFWKSYHNSNIYYRINAFTKKMKLNLDESLYNLMGWHVKVYDTISQVQSFSDNTLILIADYLLKVKDDIFYPHQNIEWLDINNFRYKNTFKYTPFLQKRFVLMRKQQLEQQLQFQPYQPTHYYNTPQTIQLFHPSESIQNEPIYSFLYPQDELQELSQKLKTQQSIIQSFISHLTENEDYFNFILSWLATFFKYLNKSSRALVLIGDKETTDIFINSIIRPIFASKKEYFNVINDEILKKTNETIIKDKIFYHVDTDNLTIENIKNPQLSKLIKELIKPNAQSMIQALENNESYIHGETIVTSSSESPYLFLKNSYSRCSVFKVNHIDTILKRLNMDALELEEMINNDLENFSYILAKYQFDRQYHTIAETDEKNALPRMKNGILRTPELNDQVQHFIDNIKAKNLSYFSNVGKEDATLYEELKYNFNEDMIVQPLLSNYFNLIHDDIIFSENSYLLEILKERAEMFSKAPDDKSKYNGKKRYKIF